jgi:hypothetical protein
MFNINHIDELIIFPIVGILILFFIPTKRKALLKLVTLVATVAPLSASSLLFWIALEKPNTFQALLGMFLPLEWVFVHYPSLFLMWVFLLALLVLSILNVTLILTEPYLTKIDLGVFLATDIFFILMLSFSVILGFVTIVTYAYCFYLFKSQFFG